MTASYDTLHLEVVDRVATITLDRPERRNAFVPAMGEEPTRAYRTCDADDGVRAVVLTGAPPAFCAGADLSAGEGTFATEVSSTAGTGLPACLRRAQAGHHRGQRSRARHRADPRPPV